MPIAAAITDELPPPLPPSNVSALARESWPRNTSFPFLDRGAALALRVLLLFPDDVDVLFLNVRAMRRAKLSSSTSESESTSNTDTGSGVGAGAIALAAAAAEEEEGEEVEDTGVMVQLVATVRIDACDLRCRSVKRLVSVRHRWRGIWVWILTGISNCEYRLVLHWVAGGGSSGDRGRGGIAGGVDRGRSSCDLLARIE